MSWQLEDSVLQGFTYGTTLCPAVHRHRKILQEIHVLFPDLSPRGKGHTQNILNSLLTIFDYEILPVGRYIREKTALEAHAKGFYQVLLTTNTEVKLAGVNPWVNMSQLKKQSGINKTRCLF